MVVSDSERGGGVCEEGGGGTVLLLSPPVGSAQFPVGELGGGEVGVQVEGRGRSEVHQAEEGKQTLRPISPFCLRSNYLSSFEAL